MQPRKRPPSFRIRRCRHGTFVALAILLLTAPFGLAQSRGPVEDFRLALRDPSAAFDAAALRVREENLNTRSAKLVTPQELSRALLLREWNYDDRNPDVANADRRAFRRLSDRFVAELKLRIDTKEALQQGAIATLVGEMAASLSRDTGATPRTEVRTLLATRLLALVAPLTRSADGRVRGTAARALGRIQANTLGVRAEEDSRLLYESLGVMAASTDLADRFAVGNALAVMVGVYSDRPEDPRETASLNDRVIKELTTYMLPLLAKDIAQDNEALRKLGLDSLRRFTQALERFTRPPPPVSEEYQRMDVAREMGFLRDFFDKLRPSLESFGNLVDPVQKLLADPNAETRIETLRLLEDLALTQIYIQTRLSNVGEKPGDEGTARDARVFRRLFLGVREPVVKTMTDPNAKVRLYAVTTVEVLAKQAAALNDDLVKRLGDSDMYVRWAAARAVGKIGGKPVPGAIEGLANLLKDPDPSVRLASAASLEAFGTEAAGAMPTLVERVNTGDPDQRVQFLLAMGAIRSDPDKALPAMAQGLSHPDVRVRKAAAENIGQYGKSAALVADPLRQALRDVDSEVRRLASEALLDIPVK